MYDLISAFGFMSFGVVVGGKISLNFTAKVAVKFKQHFQKKKNKCIHEHKKEILYNNLSKALFINGNNFNQYFEHKNAILIKRETNLLR